MMWPEYVAVVLFGSSCRWPVRRRPAGELLRKEHTAPGKVLRRIIQLAKRLPARRHREK